jgi:hypothetical protein
VYVLYQLSYRSLSLSRDSNPKPRAPQAITKDLLCASKLVEFSLSTFV